MKNSMNKFNNLMAKMIGFVVLIFAFMFVGMVNNNENVGALPTCSSSVNKGNTLLLIRSILRQPVI